MKAYSEDLLQKIVSAIERGMPKVSNMAKASTTELASPVLPFGSSGAVDLTAQANAIPPTRNAMESATNDQASQEAVFRLILPAP
jgi:hypothetical protein